jgi:hypothetical protein
MLIARSVSVGKHEGSQGLCLRRKGRRRKDKDPYAWWAFQVQRVLVLQPGIHPTAPCLVPDDAASLRLYRLQPTNSAIHIGHANPSPRWCLGLILARGLETHPFVHGLMGRLALGSIDATP